MPGYIAAQLVGAFAGAVLVVARVSSALAARPPTPTASSAVFATGPAIRQPAANLITEIIGTAVLLFGILAIAGNAQTLVRPGDVDLSLVFSRGLQPLLVGILVLGIGLSLGGPTGYAINPARDLGPRLAHAVLPIPGKRDSDWSYAWIPIVGPIIGGVLGAGLYSIDRLLESAPAPSSSFPKLLARCSDAGSSELVARCWIPGPGQLDHTEIPCPTSSARSTKARPARRFMVFDRGGSEIARHQLEHEQIMTQPGWVEHDPLEIAERTNTVIAGALRHAGLVGARPRRHRHHQSARDDGGLESRRPAGPGTTPSSGRTRAPIGSSARSIARRPARVIRERTGLAAGDLLLRRASCSGFSRTSTASARRRRSGEAVFGTVDTLGDLEPDRRRRRRRARDRRHQREPDDADGSADARLGRRAAGAVRHSARDAAGASGRRPTSRSTG